MKITPLMLLAGTLLAAGCVCHRSETAKPNTLTAAEQSAGWELLFDGRDLAGGHNFKQAGVRPGWQVMDGALVCADPHNADDIVTSNKFGAFEL